METHVALRPFGTGQFAPGEDPHAAVGQARRQVLVDDLVVTFDQGVQPLVRSPRGAGPVGEDAVDVTGEGRGQLAGFAGRTRSVGQFRDVDRDVPVTTT